MICLICLTPKKYRHPYKMDIKNIKRYNSVIISQRKQFIFWLKMQIWWNNTQLGIQIQTFYLSLFSFFQEHFFMLIFIRFISLYYPIKCRFPWKLNPPPHPTLAIKGMDIHKPAVMGGDPTWNLLQRTASCL